jgi:DNA-binding response OmpR family regulator
VLIVDDEEGIAEAIGYLVEIAGYVPMLASNGDQALELARAQWPSLVITDLMMPRMDGVGLITALRTEAERTGRRMPAIMLMTAGGMERAEEVGADLVIQKPFDIWHLERLLHQYLRPRD